MDVTNFRCEKPSHGDHHSVKSAFEDLLRSLPDTRQRWGWLLLPVIVSVSLLAFDRYGVEHRFMALVADTSLPANTLRFQAQLWLTTSTFLLLVAGPALYLWAFPERHGWGLRPRAHRDHLPVYALILIIMLPLIWIAAGTDGFRHSRCSVLRQRPSSPVLRAVIPNRK